MKPLHITLLVVFLIRGLWAEEEEPQPSEPRQEIVELEKLPPGIAQILRKLRTLKKEQPQEAVLRHLGLDKDKGVSEMDGGGSLGNDWWAYDLGDC